jgi:16S rRNA (guanine527-N7)-methyltransferase
MIDTEDAVRDWLSRTDGWTAEAGDRLELLLAMLIDENTRQNLVSRASLDAAWVRHFLDSAQLISYVPRGTSVWLDLGTGAGFPGMVVAALRPELEVIMVESRTRRVDWLERARIALDLTNATIVGTRLESVGSQPCSVISARAFAPLDRLLSLSARFSTRDTIWLLPKGRSAQQELDDLRGWRHTFHVEPSLTDPHAGIIVGKLLGRKG